MYHHYHLHLHRHYYHHYCITKIYNYYHIDVHCYYWSPLLQLFVRQLLLPISSPSPLPFVSIPSSSLVYVFVLFIIHIYLCAHDMVQAFFAVYVGDCSHGRFKHLNVGGVANIKAVDEVWSQWRCRNCYCHWSFKQRRCNLFLQLPLQTNFPASMLSLVFKWLLQWNFQASMLLLLRQPLKQHVLENLHEDKSGHIFLKVALVML